MNFLKKLFTFKWGWETTDPREIYLANSVDLVDLEQRQKQLTYGTVNPNLKGWIQYMMKKIVLWFEHIGRYRTATELARQGYHKEAKILMCGKELA